MTDAVSFRANCVAMKLNALRYHRRRYEEIQTRRVEEFSSNPDLNEALRRGVKITEVEMLYEVEAFFTQYKSCLDMLVKVLCPITGLQPGTLSTYGDFGNRVIERLNKLKKTNHDLTVGRMDWLIEEIEKTKPWLESVIRIRDTYTHSWKCFARAEWTCRFTSRQPHLDIHGVGVFVNGAPCVKPRLTNTFTSARLLRALPSALELSPTGCTSPSPKGRRIRR